MSCLMPTRATPYLRAKVKVKVKIGQTVYGTSMILTLLSLHDIITSLSVRN